MSFEEKNISQKFEEEIWLYLEDSLTPERKEYWDKKMTEDSSLKEFFNQTKETMNLLDKLPETEPDEFFYKVAIEKAVSKKSIRDKIKEFLYFEKALVPKLAFTFVLLVASVLLFVNSDKRNSVKTITSDVLSWNSSSIDSQIQTLSQE